MARNTQADEPIEIVNQADRENWLEVLQETVPADELYIEFDDGEGIPSLRGRINFTSSEGAGNCFETTMLVDGEKGDWSITYWDDPYEHYAEISPPRRDGKLTVSEFVTVELTKLNQKLRVVDKD